MTTKTLAHFFDDRWEQDRIQHFYYLATPAYQRLSRLAKHVVLKGHRGTGKTTLLRALDWRERLTNSHLRSALGDEPFADHTVGCFLQIKLLPVDMLDIWLRSSNDQVRYAIISSYLRASWIVEICAAIRGLNDARRFASYGEELADLGPVAQMVWEWVPKALKVGPVTTNETISIVDIDRIARGIMRYLRDAAAIEFPSPEDALTRLDLLDLGVVSSRVFSALATFVSRLGGEGLWTFRICMDEGEFLSEDWAVALRTLIRETDSPVYLAVSVLNSLGSSTRAAGASLSIDDREIVDLDDRPPEQMVDLLNGVMRARLELVGVARPRFDLKSFLGNPDLDELFEIAISRSERRAAERMRRRPRGGSPIREHLEQAGAIRANTAQSRRDESVGYRKKKIAGYLHLLGSLGIDRPTYAGWRIAVNMADNSVRDFVRFLRYAMELWSRDEPESMTDKDVAKFLAAPRLDYRLQDAALDRLGRQKLDSMSATLVDHVVASAVVKLFGEVSHRSDFYGDKRMGRPNANRIVVRDPGRPIEAGASYATLIRLLEQAASYGYISDLEITEGRLSCRVNRSFARHFGFSYWKPQYDTTLTFDLVGRAMTDSAAAPSKWLSSVATQPSARQGHPTLPGLGEWEGTSRG
ncbi:ORC-CDC6 family AAA ATPase [Microbacterium murale]|uniref:ATP-binding protein n=1 Tax=Microbacterium murale TaxID=1081040 RepID=A0ABQ1RYN5_9MICO|nr:hypothetical protein [Microbacterium murale]GGD86766.1 hypothetical protein GCM10007269_32060 [Microbacterium murale]